MKTRVNLQLLNTTTFDSGALGMMAMVIHQFSTSGLYRVVIMKQGQAITEEKFFVDKTSTERQLDIDLAMSVRNAKSRPENCHLVREKDKDIPRIVSPEGYVLFYASSGSGYSVIVTNTNGKKEFDSTKLAEGDLFSISLLEPAKYSMVNTLGHGKGEIVVSLTPEIAKEIKSLETNYINVNQKGFDPNSIEMVSSQGLVFRISDSARILIEKQEETPRKPRKPQIRWKKPQFTKK